jgi:Type II secretion system (T2SS), protein M
VTTRDRIVIVVVLVAAALAGSWFVVLAPKRKEAGELRTKIETATKQLTQAQQSATQAKQAKAGYQDDYATVATLGKAVPSSDALPSLLYQLQAASHDARIDFSTLKVSAAGSGAATGPTPPAAAAKAAGTGSNSTDSSASASSSASTAPAPATQAASASLPPGATVGSAGFPVMPFAFVFSGSFFDMERFLGEVQRFVRIDGERVDVRGRLLSVDGFALTAGPKGFPSVRATVSATAYLQSPNDAGTSATTPPASTAPATPTAGVTQ